MRIFSKCIFLFFSLLLLGCSFGNEDINQQLNISEKGQKTERKLVTVDKTKETTKNLLSAEQSDQILDLFEQQFHKEFIIINYDGSNIYSDNYVNLSIASKDNPNYFFSSLKYLDDLYIDRYDLIYYEITQYQKKADLVYEKFYSSIFNVDILLSSYTLVYFYPISEINDDDIVNFRVGPTMINIAIEENNRNKLEDIISYLNETLELHNDEKYELIFNVYVVNDINDIKRNTDLTIRNNDYNFTIFVNSKTDNNEKMFDYNSYYTNYLTKYDLADSMMKIK
jgi:hypothetical protein